MRRRSAHAELTEKYDQWRRRLYWVRWLLALGVGSIWVGLTALVGKAVWIILTSAPETIPYALVGTFLAWITLTATIDRILFSPERRWRKAFLSQRAKDSSHAD